MQSLKQLFTGLLLTTATVQASSASTAQESFDTTYTKAKEAQTQAAAVGGEWRDVDKMLANAKKAADAGDMDKAVTLADTARVHSELGYQQAIGQHRVRRSAAAAAPDKP